MILDNNLQLSGSWSNGVWTAQSLAGLTGTQLTTNVIDTAPLAGINGVAANQPIDYGVGGDLEVTFTATVGVTVATSVQFQLVDADDAAISVNVNVLNQTDAIPIASLTLGKQVAVHWDRATPYIPRRYLAGRYVIVGTVTVGSFLAQVVKTIGDLQNNMYKAGFAVL